MVKLVLKGPTSRVPRVGRGGQRGLQTIPHRPTALTKYGSTKNDEQETTHDSPWQGGPFRGAGWYAVRIPSRYGGSSPRSRAVFPCARHIPILLLHAVAHAKHGV